MKVSNALGGAYPFFLIGGLLFSIVIVAFYGPHVLSDSETYIQAWDNCLRNGVLDPCRTPLYPLLIGLSKLLVGNSLFLYFVILLQHILSLLSVIPFYRIVLFLTGRKRLTLLFSVIYYCISAVTWNSFIMTESLACSGMVFVVYFLYKTLSSSSWHITSLLFVSVFLLVMLRPAQLYTVFIIGLTALFLYHKKKVVTRLMSICVGVFIIMFLYCLQFKNTYGYFSVSDVSDINQYYMLRTEKLVFPEQWGGQSDSDFDERIAKGDDSVIYQEAGNLIYLNGYDGFHKNVSESVASNRYILLKKMLGRLYRAKDAVLFDHVSISTIGTIILILSPHVSGVFLLLLLFPLLYFHKLIFNTSYSHVIVGVLYLLALANVVVIIIGAQNGWGRLLYPSMPLVLQIIAYTVGKLKLESSSARLVVGGI